MSTVLLVNNTSFENNILMALGHAQRVGWGGGGGGERAKEEILYKDRGVCHIFWGLKKIIGTFWAFSLKMSAAVPHTCSCS